jgi:hypothetical protein
VTDSGLFLITREHSSARGRREPRVPHQAVTHTYTDSGIGLKILCSFDAFRGVLADDNISLTF